MATGRDENGRFVKGHKSISPGRPKQKREDRFMKITQSACTFADWRKIVKKAVTQATNGDAAARRWLADYLLGPPPQKIEHTIPEGIWVTYTNDWRDRPTNTPSRTTDSGAEPGAVQMAIGGPAVAQDDAVDGNGD